MVLSVEALKKMGRIIRWLTGASAVVLTVELVVVVAAQVWNEAVVGEMVQTLHRMRQVGKMVV